MVENSIRFNGENSKMHNYHSKLSILEAELIIMCLKEHSSVLSVRQPNESWS